MILLSSLHCTRFTRAFPTGRARFLSQAAAAELREHFTFIPKFLAASEQTVLLSASLKKLNEAESGSIRRRRRRHESTLSDSARQTFLPDEYYQFEEGHHDRVIRRYREMHLSAWPTEEEFPGLAAVVERVRMSCPSDDIQTHLLHLASDGEILPHVDHVGASGSWILGISLGGSRTLRLQHPDTREEPVDVALPPGSLYIQQDVLRYKWKHSILPAGGSNGNGGEAMTSSPGTQQRLSVMIRDRLPPE